MASLPRPSRRKCGSRNDISKNARGYSRGISSSLQTLPGGGIIGGAGIALFQALGAVPPGVDTAPISTTSSSSARATCQPPRLPAAVLRQMWVASAPPAAPIARAISTIVAAGTPLSSAANSGVYGAYSSSSAVWKLSKVTGRSGRSSRRYSSQFVHFSTNARS